MSAQPQRDWDELEQAAEREYGEAWLPDLHDEQPRTLVGAVTGYNQGPVSEYTGEQPWICAVEDRDGKAWSVWLNRTVLVNEFERKRPMPGDRVAIRYRGVQDEPSRKGAQPAHLYTLTTGAEQRLPEFITRPVGELPPPDEVPIDTEGLPPPPPVDAEVVDDDPIPF
jgi:hypothetical protein